VFSGGARSAINSSPSVRGAEGRSAGSFVFRWPRNRPARFPPSAAVCANRPVPVRSAPEQFAGPRSLGGGGADPAPGSGVVAPRIVSAFWDPGFQLGLAKPGFSTWFPRFHSSDSHQLYEATSFSRGRVPPVFVGALGRWAWSRCQSPWVRCRGPALGTSGIFFIFTHDAYPGSGSPTAIRERERLFRRGRSRVAGGPLLPPALNAPCRCNARGTRLASGNIERVLRLLLLLILIKFKPSPQGAAGLSGSDRCLRALSQKHPAP